MRSFRTETGQTYFIERISLKTLDTLQRSLFMLNINIIYLTYNSHRRKWLRLSASKSKRRSTDDNSCSNATVEMEVGFG